MQGKVMSDSSAIPLMHVGIDFCKAWLDVRITPANIVFRVENWKKGMTALLK